jgi:hypothetical protein
MRGIQKCNKMGLTIKNVRAWFFEKGAFPKCLVYSNFHLKKNGHKYNSVYNLGANNDPKNTPVF